MMDLMCQLLFVQLGTSTRESFVQDPKDLLYSSQDQIFLKTMEYQFILTTVLVLAQQDLRQLYAEGLHLQQVYSKTTCT